MLKHLQLIVLGLAISACAAGLDANAPEALVEESTVKAKVIEDPSHDDMNTMEKNEPKDTQAIMQKTELKTYWQKRLGTAVYDSQGEVIGSLRLRPTVTVYEVKADWSRIHMDNDEWVKTSDLTDIEPDDVPRPRESTGLDDLDREALKKAIETGVRPGEQK